jgi:hypothetical protein
MLSFSFSLLAKKHPGFRRDSLVGLSIGSTAGEIVRLSSNAGLGCFDSQTTAECIQRVQRPIQRLSFIPAIGWAVKKRPALLHDCDTGLGDAAWQLTAVAFQHCCQVQALPSVHVS